MGSIDPQPAPEGGRTPVRATRANVVAPSGIDDLVRDLEWDEIARDLYPLEAEIAQKRRNMTRPEPATRAPSWRFGRRVES